MMQIATVSGMSKANMRELFNQAVAGEPDYYHYYRLYANYLQTKWAGAPGEAVAFAKTSADSVGGQKGDFIYFELASLLTCGCGSGSDTIAQFSWDRVKSGYSAMEGLYGSSMLKRNRMALMATRVGDVVMAQKMFGEIGESWDAEIWRSKWDFDRSKAAALAGQRLQIGTATGQGY
jgi:hypothetical protein